MSWSIAGFGGTAWGVCLRELEYFVRRLRGLRAAPVDPEGELPDAELSEGEQRAALHREALRRRRQRPGAP